MSMVGGAIGQALMLNAISLGMCPEAVDRTMVMSVVSMLHVAASIRGDISSEMTASDTALAKIEESVKGLEEKIIHEMRLAYAEVQKAEMRDHASN